MVEVSCSVTRPSDGVRCHCHCQQVCRGAGLSIKGVLLHPKGLMMEQDSTATATAECHPCTCLLSRGSVMQARFPELSKCAEGWHPTMAFWLSHPRFWRKVPLLPYATTQLTCSARDLSFFGNNYGPNPNSSCSKIGLEGTIAPGPNFKSTPLRGGIQTSLILTHSVVCSLKNKMKSFCIVTSQLWKSLPRVACMTQSFLVSFSV